MKIAAALLSALLLTCFATASSADGRKGSHRIGGRGAHGKGSHYVGGKRPGTLHRLLRHL